MKAKTKPEAAAAAVFEYYGKHDKRGIFSAEVRSADGAPVFMIRGPNIIKDGYMSHKNDIAGLLDYLIFIGIAVKGDRLITCEETT